MVWLCGPAALCVMLGPAASLKAVPVTVCAAGDSRIHTLQLNANNIGDKGAVALAEMLKVTVLGP